MMTPRLTNHHDDRSPCNNEPGSNNVHAQCNSGNSTVASDSSGVSLLSTGREVIIKGIPVQFHCAPSIEVLPPAFTKSLEQLCRKCFPASSSSSSPASVPTTPTNLGGFVFWAQWMGFPIAMLNVVIAPPPITHTSEKNSSSSSSNNSSSTTSDQQPNNQAATQTVWIWNVCVDEAFRGQRLSLRLIRYAQLLGKPVPKPDMYLKVHNTNIPAIKIYEKAGFQPLGYDAQLRDHLVLFWNCSRIKSSNDKTT
jgi:RimJ/RimL family protein N-acetyltransferase